MPTITSQVAVSDGDVSWHNEGVGSYSRTAATILIGDSDSTTPNFNRWAAVLLPAVAIPQGATVTEAHLTLKATGLSTAIPVPLTIQAHAIDNAGTTTSRSTIESWASTAATPEAVTWSAASTPALTAWVTNTLYDTPDLKTIVQAIVNRPGWVSGNAILFFIKTPRAAYTTQKAMSFRAWDNTPADAAKLTATYTSAFTGTANAGADQTDRDPFTTVTLNGTASTGSPSVYQWRQIDGPTVTLSSTAVASPTFDTGGHLNGSSRTFGLKVGNGSTLSTEDTVTITTRPHDLFVRKSGAWVALRRLVRKAGAWV